MSFFDIRIICNYEKNEIVHVYARGRLTAYTIFASAPMEDWQCTNFKTVVYYE
jgi:hypothetical protein